MTYFTKIMYYWFFEAYINWFKSFISNRSFLAILGNNLSQPAPVFCEVVQTTQNKFMRFCLQLDELNHISNEKFERLNWLPVTYRFKQ